MAISSLIGLCVCCCCSFPIFPQRGIVERGVVITERMTDITLIDEISPQGQPIHYEDQIIHSEDQTVFPDQQIPQTNLSTENPPPCPVDVHVSNEDAV